MRRSDFVWCMLVLASATTYTFASAYKWENSDNQVEYSQVPPSNIDATKIAPPPPPASSAVKEQEALDAMQQKMIQQDKKQAEETAKAKSKAEEEKIKQYNCNQAKTRLANLKIKERIKLIDAQGNATMLTQEQRSEEIAKTEEAVKNYCSPSN